LGGYLGEVYYIKNPVILPAGDPQINENCIAIDDNNPPTTYECFDRFEYKRGDPIGDLAQNLAPPKDNPCGQPHGDKNLVGDIEILNFQQFGTSKLRVGCVDTTNRIVYLTG